MKMMLTKLKLPFALMLAAALLSPIVFAGAPGNETLQSTAGLKQLPEKPADVQTQMNSISNAEPRSLTPFNTTLLPESPLSPASASDEFPDKNAVMARFLLRELELSGERVDASELQQVLSDAKLSDDFVRQVPISDDRLPLQPIDRGGLLRSDAPLAGDPGNMSGGLSGLLTRPVDLTDYPAPPAAGPRDSGLLTGLIPVSGSGGQASQNASASFLITSSVTTEVRPDGVTPRESAKQDDQATMLNYRMLQLEKEKHQRAASVKSDDDSPEEHFWKELQTVRRKTKVRRPFFR
jgi:hypothetical protein